MALPGVVEKSIEQLGVGWSWGYQDIFLGGVGPPFLGCHRGKSVVPKNVDPEAPGGDDSLEESGPRIGFRITSGVPCCPILGGQQLNPWLLTTYKSWNGPLQGGPLLVINEVITPISGLINGELGL